VKRILMLLLVAVILFSLSTAVLAAPNGARLVFDEDGKLVEVYVAPAAKANANEKSQAANNPIDVAGKKMM